MTNAYHTISKNYPVLGKVALEKHLISQSQLDTVLNKLEQLQKEGKPASLPDLLIEAGLIDKPTMEKLLATTVRMLDKRFGDIAVDEGILTRNHINKALKIQADAFKNGRLLLISDLLEDAGILSEVNKISLLNKLVESDTTLVPMNETEPSKDEKEEPKEPELILSEDNMKAMISIPESCQEPIDIDSIKTIIEKNGITHGLTSDDRLTEQLATEQTGAPFVLTIAAGTPPVQARDADIAIFFEKEYLNPGKITPDGTIDFRDRGDVPFVKKGDLIAKKTPPVEGVPGSDIFGNPVPVKEAHDIGFSSGPGTTLSDDGLKIHADIDGQPSITVHGELSVFTELTIPGDVDYNTGNITFNGHITVRGVIKEGFSVTGGSLTAAEITGGTVNVTGNVEISGGIIDSTINAGGTVQAMYVADSKIAAYGDIIIRKEVLDSQVMTSGAFSSETATVMSSALTAKKGITASRIGSDVSRPCILKAGIDDNSEFQITSLKNQLIVKKEQLTIQQRNLEAYENKLRELQAVIAEPAKSQEKFIDTRKRIEKKLNTIKSNSSISDEDSAKIFKLENALTEITTWINDSKDDIQDNFKKQIKLTDKILKFRGVCEKTINDITKLNQNIRDIRHWSKTTPSIPSVTTLKEIYSGTSFSGPNLSIVLSDTHKNSTVKEIVRTEEGASVVDLKITKN